MKKTVMLLSVTGLLAAQASLACDIVNKREVGVGGSKGVAGECANNGLSIQCLNLGEGADSLTCIGPEGSYSGSDLRDLISTACGCSAQMDAQGGAAEQVQEELAD